MLTLTQCLPDFATFVRRLSEEYQQRNLTGWQQFRAACEVFYTQEQLDRIESVVPGWQQMASYANQQTLIHITAVFTSLYSLPEFQALDAHQQSLAEWIVMWHDIEKRAQPNKRDHTHGFRSAAVTGKALPSLGFEMLSEDVQEFERWLQRTYSAEVYSEVLADLVQDNRQLPDIIDGIDRLFSSDAYLIVKGVLLHMSLTVVEQWPAAAPLSDEEIRRYITPELLPLLRVMMLADNMAWSLFEPERQVDESRQIRAEFERIERLILPTQSI
jgi:hypothetical protein